MQDGSEDHGKEQGDDYRDDPKEFGKSSDYAQGASSSRTAGGGPTDSTSKLAGEKGSQEDWRGGEQPADGDRGPDSGGYGDVPSRSADPGQSSYGGFKDEGPVPEDVLHAQKPETAGDGDAGHDDLSTSKP